MPADQPRTYNAPRPLLGCLADRHGQRGTPAMALLVEEGTEEEAIEMTGWWAGWLAG